MEVDSNKKILALIAEINKRLYLLEKKAAEQKAEIEQIKQQLLE